MSKNVLAQNDFTNIFWHHLLPWENAHLSLNRLLLSLPIAGSHQPPADIVMSETSPPFLIMLVRFDICCLFAHFVQVVLIEGLMLGGVNLVCIVL